MANPDIETKRLIQSVARETAECVSLNMAKKVVRETLISVGIDPSDPIAAQEMQSSMRKIANVADDLSAIAAHYRDPANVEAIQFAKDVHGVYKSGRNRAIAGIGAGVFTIWVTGVWNKIIGG